MTQTPFSEKILVKGDLPDGWRWVKLGEVCKIVGGNTLPDPEKITEGFPVYCLKVSDLAGEFSVGRFLHGGAISTSNNKAGNRILNPGSVVFPKRGGAIATNKKRQLKVYACLDPNLMGVQPLKENLIDPDFLLWWFESWDISSLQSGNTVPQINRQDLSPIKFPLPPLPEQKRIAAILNEQMAAVDRARVAAEEQSKVARTLLSAYLNSLFNSSEAKKWPKKQFGEMVDNFDGMRIPIKLDVRTKKKGPYPYYGASGIIDYIDEYIFDGNFLLIGEDGANLIYRSSPIAFRASGKFWVNNHAHVVQPKGDIPLDYLLYFFSITDLKPYVTGAAQPKLTQKDMNSIPVPFPPIAEQQRIVRMANNQMGILNKAQENLQDQIDAIGKLPAALLRRAFNGEM